MKNIKLILAEVKLNQVVTRHSSFQKDIRNMMLERYQKEFRKILERVQKDIRKSLERYQKEFRNMKMGVHYCIIIIVIKSL